MTPPPKDLPMGSTISLDLGRSGLAHELKQLPAKQRSHCTKAIIHCSGCIWFGTPKIDITGLKYVFDKLSKFPNLKSLVIEMDYLSIPVSVLAVFFQSSRRLRELHLRQVSLHGSQNEYKELAIVLQKHTHLKHVSLESCQNMNNFQKLLTCLPSLQVLHFGFTGVVKDEDFLVELCRGSKLKSLVLEDVPGLSDDDVESWAQEMSNPLVETQLKELVVKSSSALTGEKSGEAIARLLRWNQTIERVTLQLGDSWDNAGASMAKVLCHNKTLTSLSLGVYGGTPTDVMGQANTLVSALACNNTLKKLFLQLDVDCVLDGNLQDAPMFATLENVLQTNDKLQKVEVSDDCCYPIEVPTQIRFQLEQNRSGISKLLHRKNTNVPQYDVAYAEALIAAKDDTSVVYYALLANPNLLLNANASANFAPIKKERFHPLSSSLTPSPASSPDNSPARGSRPKIKFPFHRILSHSSSHSKTKDKSSRFRHHHHTGSVNTTTNMTTGHKKTLVSRIFLQEEVPSASARQFLEQNHARSEIIYV